uniref:Uncharacterized protein n=1 Tax=Tanacetum cinerariifolium TaxID=118510 RepID=A0A6L2KCL0_TANCI|nr:hypothetical protein [Tanacetum cinerariifolium]
MNPIATQQAVLDNDLVPLEKRLKIERCNARIALGEHLQLSLTGAFLGRKQDFTGLGNHELKSCRVEPKKARKFKKVSSPSRKQSHVLEVEPVKKAKRVKKPTKKSTPTSTAGVIIKDTPGVSVSKKKAPAKGDKGKGWSNSQDDESNDDDDDNDSDNKDGESKDDDGNSGADDNERTDSDDVMKKQLKMREEHEKGRKGDAGMTDADQNVSQEKSYKQVVEDAHVTLTSLQKIEMDDDLLSTRIGYATRTALQSYTKEFEKKAQEERKLYINVVEKSVKVIISDEVKKSLKNVVLAKSSSQPKSTYEVATSLTEFELKKLLLEKIEKSKSYQAASEHKLLYDGLVKSYNLDKDLFSSYGKAYSLKRDQEDKDKYEYPPAGPNQRSSKGTKSEPKLSSKSVQAEEPVFETANTEMPQDQGNDMGNAKDQPNVKKKISNHERDDLFDLNVALRMPDTYRSNLFDMTPFTAHHNPQGIIYLDKYQRNRLMRLDELYKFCNWMLSYVRNVLHDIASNLRMEYLPKRRWSEQDMKSSCIMIKAIDKQLYERRLMRNLEKFVGGRYYGTDLRLLEKTI